jgi:hypothetical protein
LVQKIHGVTRDLRAEVRVAHRHLDRAVAEQLLHRLERHPQPLEEPKAKVLESTKRLSQIVGASVFAFDVYHSDVFRYVLAHNGTKKDDYTSNPAGYGAGGRSSPRGGDRAALAPYVAHLVDDDSATLDRMLTTGQLKPVVTRQERERRSTIARRISELSRARDQPDAKAEADRLRAENSSWYPRTGVEDQRDNAETRAVFLWPPTRARTCSYHQRLAEHHVGSRSPRAAMACRRGP